MSYALQTIAKIAAHKAAGYEIIEGNAPFLNKSAKWARHECVRLAQTNSRRHGRSVSTVWAVKPRTQA